MLLLLFYMNINNEKMHESSVYTGQTAPPAFCKAEINFVYLPTSYLRLLFIIHWDVSVPDMSN